MSPVDFHPQKSGREAEVKKSAILSKLQGL